MFARFRKPQRAVLALSFCFCSTMANALTYINIANIYFTSRLHKIAFSSALILGHWVDDSVTYLSSCELLNHFLANDTFILWSATHSDRLRFLRVGLGLCWALVCLFVMSLATIILLYINNVMVMASYSTTLAQSAHLFGLVCVLCSGILNMGYCLFSLDAIIKECVRYKQLSAKYCSLVSFIQLHKHYQWIEASLIMGGSLLLTVYTMPSMLANLVQDMSDVLNFLGVTNRFMRGPLLLAYSGQSFMCLALYHALLRFSVNGCKQLYCYWSQWPQVPCTLTYELLTKTMKGMIASVPIVCRAYIMSITVVTRPSYFMAPRLICNIIKTRYSGIDTFKDEVIPQFQQPYKQQSISSLAWTRSKQVLYKCQRMISFTMDTGSNVIESKQP